MLVDRRSFVAWSRSQPRFKQRSESSALCSLGTSSQVTASHPTPKTPINTFSGMQKDCKELFTPSVINDDRIPNQIKLQHLISNKSGLAKQALKGIAVTSTNFGIACDKLRRWYDSNRRRLYVPLESLINLPQVTSESAEQLIFLVDTAEEAVKGLADL